MNTPYSVSLYYSEGRSDKVYQVNVMSVDGGYHVQFAYGRRGNALTCGRKTQQPVTLAKATSIAEKLVAAKKAKGYTESDSGVAYTGTAKAGQDSGVRPQLLNVITDVELRHLIQTDGWALQQKQDGVRTMIHVRATGVEGINRKGLQVALPQPLVDGLKEMFRQRAKQGQHADTMDYLFDGELVGNSWHVWDVMVEAGRDVRHLALKDRLSILDGYAFVPPACRVYTWSSVASKMKALTGLRDGGSEGVVIKDLSAPYTEGRPNSGGVALKFKFIASATFQVAAVTTGKRSVSMQMFDANWQPIDVGHVTIPADQPVPEVGQFAECQYLYAFRGGALYQPVYKGVRTDQEREDCQLAQLFYKGETRGEREAAAG